MSTDARSLKPTRENAGRAHFQRWAVLVAVVCWGLRIPAAGPSSPASLAHAFDPARLAEIDVLVEEAIHRGDCPGAVVHVEREGAVYERAFGRRALRPTPEPMTSDTIFDAASLTKVVATTPCVLLLAERGQLDLEAPVSRYLTRFTGEGREAVTVRHLLTHTSGLRPGIPRQPAWSGYDAGIELALREKPEWAPGTQFRYSDVNFILLGEVVRRTSGMPLDEFARRELFEPLRMKETGFRPPERRLKRIAPTEMVDGRMLRGVVHDPTSRLMGGVAGHAGLFTTAADLARFCRMLLNEGILDGTRVLQPETVRRMTAVQTPDSLPVRRGLGMDIDSAYSRPRGTVFPLGSYGHTGFTGTCFWIDPFSRTFWILLSNRVHPDGRGNVLALQVDLGTAVAKAVAGFDFDHVPGALPPRGTNAPAAPRGIKGSARVLNGIDVLERDHFALLRGMRVGLITNQTGQDRRRRSTIDLLRGAPGVQLRALFSPEHGIRGALDTRVGDGRDAVTGLPIFSLYGERRAPTPGQLRGLDALVFDIQDIGCRFYTYEATLGLCMEAAGTAGLQFVVLDRVNPVNGLALEGPVHTNAPTFIAYHPIPLRHGMTLGELARMYREERGWNLKLTVVPVEGWSRGQWYDETGLPWVNPSPNMRSMTAAALYPGLGLLESALSVGRGTDTPFQVVGAPYVDDVGLADALNAEQLPGVRFLPIRFRPTYSTFKGRECGGVALIVTDRDRLKPVRTGITIAATFQRLYPDQFASEKMRPLLSDDPTLSRLREGGAVAGIESFWEPGLAEFRARRGRFLLYGPGLEVSPAGSL